MRKILFAFVAPLLFLTGVILLAITIAKQAPLAGAQKDEGTAIRIALNRPKAALCLQRPDACDGGYVRLEDGEILRIVNRPPEWLDADEISVEMLATSASEPSLLAQYNAIAFREDADWKFFEAIYLRHRRLIPVRMKTSQCQGIWCSNTIVV